MRKTPELRIIVLGSGTSAGVPMIGCHCPVCSSTDARDRRTRSSILVSYGGKSVLVDTAPELRLQAIANKVDLIHAVVFTHGHADHIFGLDDVRRYNTLLGAPLPIYAAAATMQTLQRVFPYAFAAPDEVGVYRPELEPRIIDGPVDILGVTWQPIALPHGRTVVSGFRIGDFAYCTDCAAIPAISRAMLRNLDTLIIDALRPRPHPTHLSFTEALDIIADLQPRRAYFTHLSHDVLHKLIEADLPPHVRVAYDGLTLDIPSR
ncbi:MAG: MBL fold metallo-hydrolase [Planctomycetes bacterium]|jgi:phosphoribosyl 1,2-cyclic phosphate phosphodiesterase|nr:MBL fold metallo-hydrolase [Planctomycetota bacterium]